MKLIERETVYERIWTLEAHTIEQQPLKATHDIKALRGCSSTRENAAAERQNKLPHPTKEIRHLEREDQRGESTTQEAHTQLHGKQ